MAAGNDADTFHGIDIFSAKYIGNQFATNPVAAMEEFKNKTIAVVGTVQSLETAMTNPRDCMIRMPTSVGGLEVYSNYPLQKLNSVSPRFHAKLYTEGMSSANRGRLVVFTTGKGNKDEINILTSGDYVVLIGVITGSGIKEIKLECSQILSQNWRIDPKEGFAVTNGNREFTSFVKRVKDK